MFKANNKDTRTTPVVFYILNTKNDQSLNSMDFNTFAIYSKSASNENERGQR